MSFLKEIEPLYKYVELALSGKGYPRKEIIEEISAIDYKLRQKERARIYGNPKAEVYPTDTSCGACIKSMFTNVQRWVNIYTENGETFKQEEERIKETARQMVGWTEKETVEFKGVPQVEVVNEVDVKPVSEMKWGEFKTYCKEQGLSVKGKKRAELEEELKGL